MKASSHPNAFTSLVLFAILVFIIPTGGAGTIRDAATHDQLSQKLRMEQQKDPIRDVGPPAGKVDSDPSVQTANRDLIKESTVLCYRGRLTLVPKEAVLHLPEKLKDRFEVKPNIVVQSWSDFYRENRGWIRTVEVSREQAMGEVAIPEEIVEAYKLSTSAVIATFNGGPISVLPVKVTEEETNPATTAASAKSTTPSGTKP